MKRMLLLMSVIMLGLAVAAWGQGTEDEGFERINREQIDQLNELLPQVVRIFLGVAVAVVALVVIKVVSPARIAGNARERFLRRAVRDVDDLLARIQKEMEAATEDSNSPKETTDDSLLAGMAEVAEFEQAEQVPSYVLTVNDLMLDNIGVALRRLRKRKESDAERYTDYMFSVLKGMKIITEQSVEAGVHSGLAVDIHEYFRDEKRYHDWNKVLGRFARKGKHQELAHTFLLFMKALKEGKPLAASAQTPGTAENAAATLSKGPSEIPDALNEETLPVIQRAAAEEAHHLLRQIRDSRFAIRDSSQAWQFEFVRRQQQMHSREEAQRMLSVFLSNERKSLLEITKIRMLPCRAWEHVLHMLGVESGAHLHKRIDERLLSIQEIVVLEKAFLQTLARRESLARIYGRGEKAALIMEMNIPEMRREALALLRKSCQTQRKHLDQATDALNEEETPQNGQVRKLIEHYVHHGHNPPEASQA
ncbi:MAG: hypothetical protein EHM35_10450 [Planctomycetaceae bacterium]|nr:MAG: hypothetical protein EHM35_10450 [Planctomycetaceae bacterium]